MIERGKEVSREAYQRRCVELATYLGIQVDEYAKLPAQCVEFFDLIGYVRICSMLVIGDLGRGRSERSVATRYGLTRRQIQGIKENSRGASRKSWNETRTS